MQRKWKRHWQRLTKNIFPPLAAGLLFISSYHPAYANPAGGTIVSGSATIAASGATTTINQTSQKAILNWQSFSIGSGETVNFIQPSASSVALNRVVGSDASSIYGTLSANGKVFLINPNGILFSPGSQVSVGGLVASTLNITDNDFLNSKYIFSGTGTGRVINQGTITAKNEAVLLGPKVANEGVVAAKVTGLAAGNQVTLDFSGDQLLNLTVDTSAAGGNAANSGTITASGGLVVMTAGTKDALLHTVVNNSGVIRAQSVHNESGVIRLEGSTVLNSGTLDASGKAAGQTGGTVKLLGDTVTVKTGSKIDVSGDAGGGTALIGGSYQGSGSEYTATHTTVENGATITADAITSGNGGQVVVWANDATHFAGTITARGGSVSGNGGSVETSGQTLTVSGTVDAGATKGNNGNWLLDPQDLTVDSTAANTISSALNSNTDVTLEAGSTSASGDGTKTLGDGDITIDAPLTWATGTGTLTLLAHNNINLNSSITSPNGGLNLSANTSRSGNGTTTGIITPAAGSSISVGTFTLTSGTWREVNASLSSFYAKDFRISSGTFLRAKGGDGVSNPYQIADIYGLQGIGSAGMLGNYYKLSNNIDASGTANWNAGDGFAPIGSDSSAFTGTFDGQSHTIAGLTIYRPSTDHVGLFGYTDGATLRNVGLSGGSVTGSSRVGSLVGENHGDITNAYNTGSVSGYFSVGGLVGENDGNIVSAYSTGSVSGSVPDSSSVGGLVGENYGSIASAYSTGSVSGDASVGGLTGLNSDGGSITNAYSTGSVSGASNVGGLVGLNTVGTIAGAYWDEDTSGQQHGIGVDDNNQSAYVTGLHTADMKKSDSFSAWGSAISATGGSSAVWRIYDGYTTPLLRNFLTPVAVTSVNKTYDGQTSGTTSSYTLSDANASLIGTLSYTTGSKNAGTYSTANTTGNTLSLSGLYSEQQGYDISYAPATLTVTKAALTVTATGINKTYDGTTSASVSFRDNRIAGDTLTVTGSAAFNDKNAGTGKTVNVSGISLSGADAANYTYNTIATTTADIANAAPPPPSPSYINTVGSILAGTASGSSSPSGSGSAINQIPAGGAQAGGPGSPANNGLLTLVNGGINPPVNPGFQPPPVPQQQLQQVPSPQQQSPQAPGVTTPPPELSIVVLPPQIAIVTTPSTPTVTLPQTTQQTPVVTQPQTQPQEQPKPKFVESVRNIPN